MAAGISPRLRRMQWLAVGLCTFAIALNYIDRSTLAIGNLRIRESLGLTAAGIGALQSAWSITYAFAQLPMGLMLDRVGTRKLIGWALVLWSIAQAAGGIFSGFITLLLSRMALALFECPAFPGAVRCVSNWFHPKDRGRPTGVYTVGGDVGRLIGTPLMTILLLALGWRSMFVIIGGIGLLGALVWFALYRNPEQCRLEAADQAYLEINQTTQRPATWQNWKQLFHFRSMWGMILGAFCSGYAIWMYGTWLPGYLEQQHHVSIGKTGLLAMIPLGCSVFGSLTGGHATDWLAHAGIGLVTSRKVPTVCGLLASSLFCGLAANTQGLDGSLIYISTSMFCLSFAQSGHWTLVTAIAPQSHAASVASIQNFGSYLGGTVSPLLTGIVVDMTGSFDLALAIGAAAMIIAAFFYGIVVRDAITLDDGEQQESFVTGPAPAV